MWTIIVFQLGFDLIFEKFQLMIMKRKEKKRVNDSTRNKDKFEINEK